MSTDYSNRENWMKFDYDNPDKANTKVDVIFINGTVLNDPDQENGIAYISDVMRTAFTNGYAGTADVFDSGTRMYVPYYRQIALNYILDNAASQKDLPDMMKRSEALEDINAFLKYYFDNCNEGRPFIIAGLSQGGAAVQIALEKFFGEEANKSHLRNMIAAYSIAYGVDKKWLSGLDYLKFTEGASDTGVVICWLTEGPGKKEKDFLIPEPASDSMIVNPVSWKADEVYVSASENPGSYIDGKIVTPGLYNLQLDKTRGCLICDNNTGYLPGGLFGGKSLHMYEIEQAYVSIRKNMHNRIESFFANGNN